MNDMLDHDVCQAIYQLHRVQHVHRWFQSNAENFCARKEIDPATGRRLPGAYIPEET